MSFTKYETDTGDEKVPLLIMHGLFGSKSNWNSMSKAFLKQLNRNVFYPSIYFFLFKLRVSVCCSQYLVCTR